MPSERKGSLVLRRRDPRIGLLRELPTLSSYTLRELTDVASLFTEVSASPGDILAVEGSPVGEVFLVVRGLATLSRGGQPIARVGPGEFLCEPAMFAAESRSVTVTAETPMKLLETDAARFFKAADDPGIARAVARAYARRLRLAAGTGVVSRARV